MLATALIAFREGIEIALVIGILTGILNKMNARDKLPIVWVGVATSTAVVLVIAAGLAMFGISLPESQAELYEGILYLLAAAFVTWMMVWMARSGKYLKADLEARTRQALTGSAIGGVFSIAFFSVFRELFELSLMVLALESRTDMLTTIIGTTIGIVIAALVGYLFFRSMIPLNLQKFFFVTNILLALFAIGLVGNGIHELNEVGVIPGIVEHVWDMNHILSDKSSLGLFLKAFFGYNGNPSLTEVGGMLLYTLGLIIYWQRDIADRFLFSKLQTNEA